MIRVIMAAIAVCFVTSAGFAGSCCAAKKAEAAKANCAPAAAANCAPAAADAAKPAAKDTASTTTVIAKK